MHHRFIIFSIPILFSLLIINCSNIKIRLVDTISFDTTTEISSMTLLDLDKNNHNEIILSSLTYQTNAYGDKILRDSSIFIFEENKNHYKYIWKSSPLTFLTSDFSVLGEYIYDIRNSFELENPSVLIYGEKNLYKLYFNNDNYHLITVKKDSDYTPNNQDIPSYFSFPIRSYFLFSQKNIDYIFLTTGEERESKLHIYKVQYKKKKQFLKKIDAFSIPEMKNIKVFSTQHNIILLGSSLNHSLLIYKIKGL